MVRMSILRLVVSVAVVFSIVNAPTCEARPSPLEKLDSDSADLTDLLDAPLDETFLQRNLQEATTAPTPAPGDLSTSSPTFAGRDLISAAPTPAPVDATRGFSSMAPTATPTAFEMGTAAPTASETSGAMGIVQAAASLATAATVLMATAVIA